MIIESLLISILIQLIMFIPAFKYKTDKLTDLSYALTFIVLTWVILAVNQLTIEKIIIAIMVSAWGIRLGGFLFKRIKKMNKDSRFDEMRNKFFKFLSFWLIQGLTVWLVMMSVSLFMGVNKTNFNYLSIIGMIIWIIGLSIESIADNQKYAFKQNSKNKGKWIKSGIWKYSRHPNYFGEITNWTGIYIYCLSSLTGLNAVIGLLTPFYIAFTILFISGVPILEKNADKKWGKDKDYIDYKNKTSLLIPWFNK